MSASATTPTTQLLTIRITLLDDDFWITIVVVESELEVEPEPEVFLLLSAAVPAKGESVMLLSPLLLVEFVFVDTTGARVAAMTVSSTDSLMHTVKPFTIVCCAVAQSVLKMVLSAVEVLSVLMNMACLFGSITLVRSLLPVRLLNLVAAKGRKQD